MSNKLLTPTQVLKEAQRVLHNNLVFVKNVNKQYSNEFAVSGAKVGSTINVRLPNRYYVSKTTALQAQSTNETTVPVTLTTNYQWASISPRRSSPFPWTTSRSAFSCPPWPAFPHR